MVGWVTSSEHQWVDKMFYDCVEASLVDKDVVKFVEAFTSAATSEAISSGC